MGPEAFTALPIELPDLVAENRLHAVLTSAIRARAGTAVVPPPVASARILWPAEHFGLERVACYREAAPEEQAAVLRLGSRGLLEEAYHIEKCGMYFAAKMSLLSDTLQERMLYSFFASDEATHFDWIQSALGGATATPEGRAYATDPFLGLLKETLQHEDKLTLAYVIQVVLEGWGLSHYQALKRSCVDARMRETLGNILKDEARHHGSGLLIVGDHLPAPEQIDAIVDVLTRFFYMIQAGPQATLAQLAQVKGHLSRAQRIAALEDLDCEADTARKLAVLRGLIQSTPLASQILPRLESAGALRPFSAQECAAISQGS